MDISLMSNLFPLFFEQIDIDGMTTVRRLGPWHLPGVQLARRTGKSGDAEDLPSFPRGYSHERKFSAFGTPFQVIDSVRPENLAWVSAGNILYH
jgi:hypothetical protein